MFTKDPNSKDLRENGRVILAHGEVTGHAHEVVDMCALAVKEFTEAGALPTDYQVPCDVSTPAAEFFEEPDGRRVLLVLRPCVLLHQEHGRIALDPEIQTQVRQGDVLLQPIGPGVWEVIRQREYEPEGIRQVAD